MLAKRLIKILAQKRDTGKSRYSHSWSVFGLSVCCDTFEYNTAFGQVNKINHNAPDAHLLSYTSYNVNSATGQTECPRFTERHDWAQYWNGDTDDVPATAEEAFTYYAVDGSVPSAWTRVKFPDGTVYKEYFATTGWQTGLTTTTKNYVTIEDEQADTDQTPTWKKKTTTTWTQDNTGLTYQKNPRITETNIYDSSNNRRRAVMSYTTFTLPSGASCSLPNEVTEYQSDATTVLRRSHTDYLLTSAYLDRRVIGLPEWKYVYDAPGNLAAKSYFKYDWDVHLDDLPGATHHDDTNYSKSALIIGRGNLSMLQRYDITDPNNTSKVVEFKSSYNTTGQVTLTRDMRWHQTFISYTDSFSDGINRNTYAYPTTFTDGDGYQTLVKYNFDFGGVTWQQTPSPNAGQTAPTVSYTYDSATRPQQVTSGVNGAYTRWEYPGDALSVKTFATINTTAEAYSAQILDGAGRVRDSISDHPGSTGLYRGQDMVYDVMGRLWKQSNPIEITASWSPTGDDSAWVYTQQTYDWKGRPLVTTNTDGTTRDNTYGGCGCAGGEVVTVRDEAGRRRRLTMDVVGRLSKVEELNFNQTVYSTTTYGYNVLDQVQSINHAGQTRTFDYDGHGRLWHKITPEQGSCTYAYWEDDEMKSMTDARGAKSTFDYNGRHLLTSIVYDLSGVLPGQNVASTANVTYGYDAAGNRTSMSDGLGSASYSYNQLSRLTSESRTFAGLGGPYTLSYQYNLAGELTSITNPFGVTVGYGYDKTGRPTSVTGSGYYSISTYISNISYRAFGPKQVSYGNTRALLLSYNNRMFLTQWNVPGVLAYGYHYDYYGENNTGRVTFADNLYNGASRDATLDRSWYYEDMGRFGVGYTGSEARATIGTDTWGHPDGPYAQGYGYDVWGNRTHEEGWGGIYGSYTNGNPTYTSNRRNGGTYDLAGNYTAGGAATYDATGQQVAYTTGSISHVYDGDRLRGKKVDHGVGTYYVRSSVLGGQVVAEINSAGTWMRGYVYLGGQLIALQDSGVYWVHQEPYTKGQRFTTSLGVVTGNIVEVDPWGGNTARSVSSAFQPHLYTSYERDSDGGDDAMNRRYSPNWSRFSQPDPYDGSYDPRDPQSLNRYSYVNNDPVDSMDPTGLLPILDCSRMASGDGLVWYQCDISYVPGPHFPHEPNPRGGGPGGQDRNPSPPPDQLKKAFYELYQKKLARCIWQVFRTDLDGQPMNTAQVMERQTLRNSPIVDMSQTMGQIGAQGYETDATDPYNGRYGTIHIASNLPGWHTTTGQTISVQENYFRTYAHELGNLLSARYTGDGNTHGIRAGIMGAVSGSILDFDTGARLESCIFGNGGY